MQNVEDLSWFGINQGTYGIVNGQPWIPLSGKACSHYHLDEDDVKAKLGEASVYHLEENDVEVKPPSIILTKTTLRRSLR